MIFQVDLNPNKNLYDMNEKLNDLVAQDLDEMPKETTSRRRISVDLSTAEAVGFIHDTMNRLTELWDEISMEECTRAKRVESFYKHIKHLLDEIVSDETDMVRSVHSGIEELKGEVEEIRRMLNLPSVDISRYEPGSLALYRALNKECARLRTLKENRLEGQKKLSQELADLAMRTGEELENLPSSSEICGDTTLINLQERVSQLNEILQERMQLCRQWQADMYRWHKQMGKSANTEMGINFNKINLEDNEQVFDTSFVDKFEEAHKLANAEYNEWLEQARFSYTEALLRLTELWNLCHVPEMERLASREFNPAIHTAADVEHAQEMVQKLERYLEHRANVYNKLKEWKDLWAEKVDYENHASDKSSYKNRGGELQTILKKEIKREVEKYEAEHVGDRILLDGLTPCEHVEYIMEEYRTKKELEKMRKKQGHVNKNETPWKRTPMKRNIPTDFTASSSSSAKAAKLQARSKFGRPLGVAVTTPLRSSSRSTSHPKTSSPNAATDGLSISPVKNM